jgi:hypothetical protein
MSEVPPTKFDQEVRTDIDCHECNKIFVALIDYRIDGNHIIICAHCGHEHCRLIEKGKITGERWSSRYGKDKDKDGIRARRTWKVQGNLVATSSSASEIMRQRWLERGNT